MEKELTLAEARALLKEKVTTLRPYEIALAEQELKTLDDDECRKENIQQMMRSWIQAVLIYLPIIRSCATSGRMIICVACSRR